MQLKELRESWEEGLQVIAESDRGHQYLVVLLKNDGYYCHRYFCIDGDWKVSVDGSYVSAHSAIEWALNPKPFRVLMRKKV